ncbi:hypothetical protein [Paraburkholderia sp. MM6662-R1]|uniref:hypothetical protein n=1 Tax=Paraburkholderia sp. MM6662-R1 TaxID=2991066 RepID=UPI003D2013CC
MLSTGVEPVLPAEIVNFAAGKTFKSALPQDLLCIDVFDVDRCQETRMSEINCLTLNKKIA